MTLLLLLCPGALQLSRDLELLTTGLRIMEAGPWEGRPQRTCWFRSCALC